MQFHKGSILSPILFTCYTSTQQELFTSHNSLSGYADDHSLIKSFSPIDYNILLQLELDIKHISDWMYWNHLKMNNAKTEFITFGSRSGLKKQYLSEIRVGNYMVKSSETIRFLGITLDKELEMKKFTASKARNAYFNIQKIKKIRKFLTEDKTKMLTCSNVLSHLDYGNSILVNLPKSTLNPLQSIQNYAAKIICKKQKYDSSTEYLYKLHWLPIHYRCIYKLMTIVFKTLNEQEPQYLADKLSFKTFDMTTRYNTSNSKQLVAHHLTEKEHKETEALALQDQATGNNYQIISRKQRTWENSRNPWKHISLDYLLNNPLRLKNTYIKYNFIIFMLNVKHYRMSLFCMTQLSAI